MKTLPKNIKTGDIITTSVYTIPVVLHRGIAVVNSDDGKVNIYHICPDGKNQFGGSVLIEPLDKYLSKRNFIGIKSTGTTKEYIEKVYEITKDKKFNLFTFNCEHFTSMISNGFVLSPQLTFWYSTIIITSSALITAYLVHRFRYKAKK